MDYSRLFPNLKIVIFIQPLCSFEDHKNMEMIGLVEVSEDIHKNDHVKPIIHRIKNLPMVDRCKYDDVKSSYLITKTSWNPWSLLNTLQSFGKFIRFDFDDAWLVRFEGMITAITPNHGPSERTRNVILGIDRFREFLEMNSESEIIGGNSF